MITEEEKNEATAEPNGDSASRVTELEGLLATRDEELTKASGCLAETEHALADSEQRLSAVTEGLKQAVLSYRSLVVKSHPGVPEEMIKSDSVAEIDLSLKSAQELIGRVKNSLEAERAAVTVPAGAPVRTAPAASALSPREKIQQGIERGKF